MTTTAYAMPGGMELRLFTTHSPFGTHASIILFDDDARILGETDSTMYMGYCRPCMALGELRRAGMPDAIQEAFTDWHPCECACDCGECEECEDWN